MSEQTRPESGPMRFGDDWTGVFIRGDHAGWSSYVLRKLREELKDKKIKLDAPIWEINNLIRLLGGCIESPQLNPEGVKDCQNMKSFSECVESE